MLKETWYILLILLVIVNIVLFIREPDRKTRMSQIAALLLATITLLSGYVLPEILPEDYSDISRSYLEPTLVIENVDENGYDLYYEVRNLGSLPASDIRFMFKCSRLSVGENITPMARSLASNATMNYSPQPLRYDFPTKDQFENYTLVASYTARIGGEERQFLTVFRTILAGDRIKNGNYQYNDAERREGTYTQGELLSFTGLQGIQNQHQFSGKLDFNIVLKDTSLKYDKYIVDMKLERRSDRVSVFIDASSNLNFRIVDADGKVYRAIVNSGNVLMRYNDPLNLSCEYGKKGDSAYIRIGVDGNLAAETMYSDRMNLAHMEELKRKCNIGADLIGNHRGVFALKSYTLSARFFNAQNIPNFKIVVHIENRNEWDLFRGREWIRANPTTGDFFQLRGEPSPIRSASYAGL